MPTPWGCIPIYRPPSVYPNMHKVNDILVSGHLGPKGGYGVIRIRVILATTLGFMDLGWCRVLGGRFGVLDLRNADMVIYEA